MEEEQTFTWFEGTTSTTGTYRVNLGSSGRLYTTNIADLLFSSPSKVEEEPEPLKEDTYDKWED